MKKLKIKVDSLDVGKLTTLPPKLKKLSDVVHNQVVKSTKFNTLITIVNELYKEIPVATTLLHINQ